MTSLSAGLLIKQLLAADTAVAAITSDIFPLVSEDTATLPYICYRRAGLDDQGVKSLAGADTCTVEVYCYAASYAGSIALAEAVRSALDNQQGHYTSGQQSLIARSIRLIDATEAWADDAYAQILTFSIKIN